MPTNTHSSQRTADEYTAKHEPDVAKKMANLWESKLTQNDGGKLPPTFCKDPAEVAANRNSTHAPVATDKTLASSATRLGGSMGSRSNSRQSSTSQPEAPKQLMKQKSFKEAKSRYEKPDERANSSTQSAAEVEKTVKLAVAQAEAKAETELKSVQESHKKEVADRLYRTSATIATLEKQLKQAQETLSLLKSEN